MKLDFCYPSFHRIANEETGQLKFTAGLSAQPNLLKYLVEDVLPTDTRSYQMINKKKELTFIKKLKWQSLNVHNLNLPMIWETCILIPNFRARKSWLESYDLHSDLMQT